jgi:hypothetical protein
MATAGDSSQAAMGMANLQSQLAAGNQQAKNEDPDGIFELFTELFNQAFSFVGKVAPIKVMGLVSTGIDANVKLEPSAPIAASKPMKPGGEGGAQGGVMAKGLAKVLGFKNFLSGLSAPSIEALAQMESTMLNVSWSDLGGLSPQSFGGGIDMGRSSGVEMS